MASIVGAIAGLASFLLLVGWWTGFSKVGLCLGYALAVGAATGGAYSGFLRFHQKIIEGAD